MSYVQPFLPHFVKEAKHAYESVMVIRPRRPTTDEFFDFEKEAMRLSLTLYNYTWPINSEVQYYSNVKDKF